MYAIIIRVQLASSMFNESAKVKEVYGLASKIPIQNCAGSHVDVVALSGQQTPFLPPHISSSCACIVAVEGSARGDSHSVAVNVMRKKMCSTS